MANTDSTVRLRQLNQSEVSGYILQVVSGILGNNGTYIAATGVLTGAFYPRPTNPSGYLRSGEAATLYDIDNAIAQENVYIATTYYPASNPNRYISATGVVYTTGNQTIAGIKEFSGSYITVINPINVVGVVAEGIGLDGEHYDDWANGYIIYGDEGNPTIDLGNRRMFPSGSPYSLDWQQKVLTGYWSVDSLVASIKLQAPILYATERTITPSIQTTGQVTGINVNQRRLIKSNGVTPTLDWESGILLGTWNASGLTILGQPIVTGNINNFPNIVYTTGDQTIVGNKAFNAPLYGSILTAAGQETWKLDLVNGKVQKYKLESTLPYPLYATTTYIDFNSSALKDNFTTTLDWKRRILSGEWNVEKMRISGVPVSTGGGSSFVDDGTFVRTTGTQSIDGVKTFTSSPVFPLGIYSDYISPVTPDYSTFIDVSLGQIWLDYGGEPVPSIDWIAHELGGYGQGVTLNWQNRILSGDWRVGGLTISGNPVSTGQTLDTTYLVNTTGIQAISGMKNFVSSEAVLHSFTSGVFINQIHYSPFATSERIFDFPNGLIYYPKKDFGGHTALAIDLVQHALFDTSTGGSLNWNARELSGNWKLNGGALSTGGQYAPMVHTHTGYLATGNVTGISGVTTYASGSIIVFSGNNASSVLGLPDDGAYGGVNGNIAGISAGDRVENAFDKVDVILGKLAPAKPLNLSSANFVLTGTTYTALMQGGGGSRSNVIASLRPTGYATGFYDGDAGILSGYINGTLTGSRVLSTGSDVGAYTGLNITVDSDFWAGVAGKSGFWSYLNANVSPLANLPSGQFTMQMRHSTAGSTPVLTGYCDVPLSPTITLLTSGTGTARTRYVDGIISLAGTGTADLLTGTYSVANAIGAFYSTSPYTASATQCSSSSTFSVTGSPLSGNTQIANFSMPIANSVYSTGIQLNFQVYNSAGSVTNTSFGTRFRVDTNSTQQTGRRSSSTGQYPVSISPSSYNDLTLLHGSSNEELQMINGAIQYPPTTNYGVFIPSGANYSTGLVPGSYSNYRWATFTMPNISNASNVKVTFNNTANFVTSPMSSFCLYVKVSGATNGWIDGNAAYPGVGNPTNNGDAAYASGDAANKVITFGTATLSGPVYIRVGLQSGSNRSFGSISMTQI